MDVRKKIRAAKKENVKLEFKKEEVREDSRQLIAKIKMLRRELSSCSRYETGCKRTLIATNLVVNQLAQYCRANTESVGAIKEKRILQLENELTNQEVIESADGTRLLVNGFTFQLPKRVIAKKYKANSTVSCRGCKAPLPVHRSSNQAFAVSVEYFKHVFNCPQYLDKVGKCEKCKIIFVDSGKLNVHTNKTHAELPEKPDWMTERSYKDCRFGSFGKKSAFCDISCPGCKKVFLAKKTKGKRNMPELKFYMHCIDECEEYKTLIRTCQTCDKKFLNPRSLHIHESLSGHLSPDDEPVRSWMTKNLMRSRHNRAYNSTINCRGCGKEFSSWKPFDGFNSSLIHRAYHVHCIEECEEYRQLDMIRTCDKCKCKFTSPLGLNKHACHY